VTRRTVVDIATQVAAGSLSASTVLEENLAAITAREQEIHAFNLVTADRARERAAEIDADVKAGKKVGRLAGVTISLKDNMCTRGVETTCSSKILAGWKPPYDATVVRRLADEGAVFVGKTNLDEFAMGSSTENSAFGPTRNPLDTSRVPGGSSGGSAAAVAAGFSAASFGSDTGGSIRQPAALCGLVGVKPTYGMVSRQGLIAFGSSLDQIGPFTTTVADAALLMEVIAGHDPLDSTSLPQPAPQLTSVLANGVKGLRIGRVADMPEGSSPDVLARLDAAFEALRAAGATVVDVKLPSMSFGLTAYYLVAPAEASSNLARFDGVRYGLRVDAKDLNAMYGATRAATHERARQRCKGVAHRARCRHARGFLTRCARQTRCGIRSSPCGGRHRGRREVAVDVVWFDGVLPGGTSRGEQQPRTIRRRALWPACRRQRSQCHVWRHPRRGFR
jgi:aspartyl-tRNA(Asn)/glutamyl-tRNA(Gln) amidotransferase subunit A